MIVSSMPSVIVHDVPTLKALKLIDEFNLGKFLVLNVALPTSTKCY